MPRIGQGASVAPKVPDTSAHLEFVTVPDGAQGLAGKVLLDCGSITAPGTYVCRVNSTGMNYLAMNLRPSAVTGTFAPSLRTTWLADGSARTTVAGANFAANTNQQLEITDLRGQRSVELVFTIPGGGAVTFDRAEFNGL